VTIGPIQLIAIAFEDFKPKGHILQELNAQAAEGTIRLVDAQIVRKTRDGHVLTAEITGLSEEEAAEFGSVIRGLIGAGAGDAERTDNESVAAALVAAEQSYGLSLQDVHRIADELEPGNAVALLLIEHTWAIGFRDAVIGATGKVVAQGFLTPETLLLVGRELEAQTEAMRAIELSEAIQEEAAIEAVEAVVLSQAIQYEAAREAAEALLAAEIIEEAAFEEAIAVVATTMAVEEAAVVHAEDVVAEAEAVEAAAHERASAAEQIAEAKQPAGSSGGAPASHSLSYVEGIGPVYAQQLKDAGIDSTQELLEAGATPKGRAELAEASGISGKLILEWVNHVDLFRIAGVGSEYADLLEAAGVDTVPELAQRNPANLHQKLSEVNDEKHLVRHVPALSSVEDWIGQAKSLPRKITY
jgi:predicted flap endonuclease-1-like 5' DNA nuclease/uncharacterized membrane protein